MFKFKSRVFDCREMGEIEGGHTCQNICNYIQDMLSSLNITLDRVKVFFARQCKKS